MGQRRIPTRLVGHSRIMLDHAMVAGQALKVGDDMTKAPVTTTQCELVEAGAEVARWTRLGPKRL